MAPPTACTMSAETRPAPVGAPSRPMRPWLRMRSRVSNMHHHSRSVRPAASAPALSQALSSSTSLSTAATVATASTVPRRPDSAHAHSLPREPVRMSRGEPIHSQQLPHARAPSHDELSTPRRLVTDTSQRSHFVRALLPPPSSHLLHHNCASITQFLRPVTLPMDCVPETADTSFKAHCSLLRKIALHHFELNRYLFAYKPLARVHAVMAATLLSPAHIDSSTFPMSSLLRTAVMYLAGNSYRNVYVMTYAAQLKSIHRSTPPAQGIMPSVLLKGHHLAPSELLALDFAQQLLSDEYAVSEAISKRFIDMHANEVCVLDRYVAATCAYGAFLSTLTSTLDLELTHAAIQYASTNLQGLPWKSSAAPLNVGFTDDDLDNFGSSTHHSTFGAKVRPMKERFSLHNNYHRHNQNGRSRPRAIRKMSHFLSQSIITPKIIADVNRVTENWMSNAHIPSPGQLFEANDFICHVFGFEPFYFSTQSMAGEPMRRAFLYGCTELLFGERDIPRRLKFILCYVLSSGRERRRIDADHTKSFETQGVHNGRSITSVYKQRPYDALSIMSAHAAYLACKYGSSAAELVAATDVSRVRSAMERYRKRSDLNMHTRLVDFPLPKRDCAAIVLAHSLLQESPCISEVELLAFEASFGSTKDTDQASRNSRRAFLEVLGTACMWSSLERYATGVLAFDIDCTSNLVFGTGRAEPTITEFCQSVEGKKIGLSLAVGDDGKLVRARSDPKATRAQSLRSAARSKKRLHRKRTSSVLSTGLRVARMFSTDELRSKESPAVA
eukprot:TRINITY_DN756_c2_g1_i1.p1 TRINITY_DN756_c2_g1~~TRINITY_DN756_c2_g1_i1.p1  ORF type:complete len:785 (+),score=147.27 TRINITY_DN756_c2_g1_i1:334-2688(+)